MTTQQQRDEFLSYPRIKYRLSMMIEAASCPVHNVAQANEIMKNLRDDLRLIKVSIEELNAQKPC